jgi:hypothetical protein
MPPMVCSIYGLKLLDGPSRSPKSSKLISSSPLLILPVIRRAGVELSPRSVGCSFLFG